MTGIVKKYEPKDMAGKTIVAVTKLKPTKLTGVESQGIVFVADGKEFLGLVTIAEGAFELVAQVRKSFEERYQRRLDPGRESVINEISSPH